MALHSKALHGKGSCDKALQGEAIHGKTSYGKMLCDKTLRSKALGGRRCTPKCNAARRCPRIAMCGKALEKTSRCMAHCAEKRFSAMRCAARR